MPIDLPKRYSGLYQIRSVQTRIRTTQFVRDILDQLQSLQQFELTKKTQNIIDRFFIYLEQTCQDVSLVNKRASWLLVYAQIVYTKLIRVQNTIQQRSYPLQENSDLFKKIVDLLNRLCLYQVRYAAWKNDQKLFQSLTDSIIFSCHYIKADPSNSDYASIVEKIDSLSQTIMKYLNCRTLLDDQGSAIIIRDLRNIDHHLSTYLLHQHRTM